MRRLAVLILALAPLCAGAQTDDLAALRARVAELEAQAARDAEIISNLRARLDAKPTDPADMETLRGRILNQTQEINALRLDLDRCRTARNAEAGSLRRAESDLQAARLDARRAEDAVRAARRDADRAESEARRARSEASRARSASRRCR